LERRRRPKNAAKVKKTMSSSLKMARRYREFAAECVRLAGISGDQPISDGFRRLAGFYLNLAQTELADAESAAGQRTSERPATRR
jgi:hypothetical protein